MKRLLLLCALLAGSLTLGACNTTNDAESHAAPVNMVCPVSGEALGDDAPTIEFEGKTVAFCCGGCRDDWNAMSMSDQKMKLTESMR